MMYQQLEGLRLAVLIDRGVNEIEYHYICLRMMEAGAEVVTVGNHTLETVGEAQGNLMADSTIEQLESIDFDGVLIPGGLGPEKLRQNPRVVAFVRELHERGKVCAAICHGQQVFISAGMLVGKKAVAAWSMVDDLIFTKAIHDPELRAVRDEHIVTARFPHDLPQFCGLLLEAFAEVEGRPVPARYGKRLQDKTFGIVVDNASHDMQVFYPQLRIQEDGGTPLILGSKAGLSIRLGNETWEWGDYGGLSISTERALENVGAVDSNDFPYEEALRAIKARDLDGLILPGGLGSWMIRGHPGLKKLIREMDAVGKLIIAVERGPKILLSAGILAGRRVTCSLEMRDDLVVAGINYQDEPIIQDGNLVTCQSTEDLPAWGRLCMQSW